MDLDSDTRRAMGHRRVAEWRVRAEMADLIVPTVREITMHFAN
jgi:hypothetical protein